MAIAVYRFTAFECIAVIVYTVLVTAIVVMLAMAAVNHRTYNC